MTYNVTLKDGTKFENLTRNGDAYMSLTKPDETVFTEDNMSSVTIEEIPGKDDPKDDDRERTTVYDDLVFRSIFYHTQEKKWGINFHQLTTEEKKELNLKKILDADSANISDVQEAVAELYELIVANT